MDNGQPIQLWSDEHKQLIIDTFCKELTSEQTRRFLHDSQAYGLNPLNNQIYAIKRAGKLQIVVGIDGYRAIAHRNGTLCAILGPFFAGKDGVWREVLPDDEMPIACKVGLKRTDFTEPIWNTAHMVEFNSNQGQWTKLPRKMLEKCAEAGVIRKAYPHTFVDIYLEGEQDAADRKDELLPVLSALLEEAIAKHPNLSELAKKTQDNLDGMSVKRIEDAIKYFRKMFGTTKP